MNKIRYCAAGLVLVLPGSFFVVPLLWLWRWYHDRSIMIAQRQRPPRKKEAP